MRVNKVLSFVTRRWRRTKTARIHDRRALILHLNINFIRASYYTLLSIVLVTIQGVFILKSSVLLPITISFIFKSDYADVKLIFLKELLCFLHDSLIIQWEIISVWLLTQPVPSGSDSMRWVQGRNTSETSYPTQKLGAFRVRGLSAIQHMYGICERACELPMRAVLKRPLNYDERQH